MTQRFCNLCHQLKPDTSFEPKRHQCKACRAAIRGSQSFKYFHQIKKCEILIQQLTEEVSRLQTTITLEREAHDRQIQELTTLIDGHRKAVDVTFQVLIAKIEASSSYLV